MACICSMFGKYFNIYFITNVIIILKILNLRIFFLIFNLCSPLILTLLPCESWKPLVYGAHCAYPPLMRKRNFLWLELNSFQTDITWFNSTTNDLLITQQQHRSVFATSATNAARYCKSGKYNYFDINNE